MAEEKTKTKVKFKLKRGDTVEVIAGKDKASADRSVRSCPRSSASKCLT